MAGKRCGAKSRRGGFCRAWAAKNSTTGRCKMHGGGRRAGWRARGKYDEAIARRRALGLGGFGGRLPGTHVVVSRMEKAKEAGLVALELMAEAPASGSGDVEMMREGFQKSVKLSISTIDMVQAQLDELGKDIDLKLLRVGNEAGQHLTRTTVRIFEDTLRARKDDRLGNLLERIAQAKLAKPTED